MKELNQKQRTRINQLIRKECANLTTDGDCLCLGDKCPQLNSFYHLYCNYFRKAILPLDKELSVELAEEDSKKAVCQRCKKLFLCKRHNEKYCEECKTKRIRESKKEYMRKRREKNGK